MRRCKILAPRKEAVILDGIQPTDTFGALRARAKVELKSASQHSLLLLHGQQVSNVASYVISDIRSNGFGSYLDSRAVPSPVGTCLTVLFAADGR